MISFSVLRATSEQSSLCSGLFFACGIKISHPPAYLLLLIRKKARLVHLLGCKRPRDGSLSLPPFCDEAPVARGIFFGRLNHVGAKFALLRLIFCLWHKNKPSARLLAPPYSQKSTLAAAMPL